MQKNAHVIPRKKASALVAHLRHQRNISRTRRSQQYLGMALLVLFLMISFLAVNYSRSIETPQGATSDVIYGGTTSKEELLLTYDNPKSQFSSLAHSLEITRSSLNRASYSPQWSAKELGEMPLVVWSMSPTYLPAAGQSDAVNGSVATIKNANSRYLFYGTAIDDSLAYTLNKQPIYRGVTPDGMTYAILTQSGNIITTWDKAQTVNFCYRSPDPDSLLNCPNSNRYHTKMTIENTSYKTDGHFIKNRPGDTLRYTLSIKNASKNKVTLQPRLLIDDILEYSDTITPINGEVALERATVQWPIAEITPETTQSFSFTARLKRALPLVRQNETNAQSNDCTLSIYYGNTDSVAIICPPQKVIERSINRILPYDTTTIGAWVLLFGTGLLAMRNTLLVRRLDYEIKKYQEGHSR